jgi:membrane protein
MNNQEREGLRASVSPQSAHQRQSLTGLLRTAWNEYERDYARYFAVAIVYYALVSLVPLLLLLLAGLGLLLRLSEAAAAAERLVLSTIEGSFGSELRATIEHLLQGLQQSSLIATSVSLIGLLLTASILFKHMRMTFRAIWKHAPPLASGSVRLVIQATFLERMVAFLMVLAGGGLLLAAFALLAVIHWLTGWRLALPAPLLVAPLVFALLFKHLPPVQLRWRHVWLASVLCGAAWLLGAEVLALYSRYLANSLSAYGALGAVLVIMLWMNIVSQVLFFGAELCKVVFWSNEHRFQDAVRAERTHQ